MSDFGDPEARVTVCGKQVMFDGEHLADARDDAAAQVIGMAIHFCGVDSARISETHFSILREFFK